jgi:hypothetical protein
LNWKILRVQIIYKTKIVFQEIKERMASPLKNAASNETAKIMP